jgi:tight adherence protein B
MPNAIDLMVSAMRAGHSLIGALGTVATDAPEPIRREFRLCFEEQNFGMDLRVAMANLLHRVPLPDLRIVVTAILIQKESGGNLAESLEKTAQVIRGRFRLRDQIRIQTAQSRATGAILATMPVFLGTVLYFVNPRYMRLLVTDPLGRKMMAFGAIMNVLGLLLIRKIVRIRL